RLMERIEDALPRFPVDVTLLVPYGREDVTAMLYRNAEVLSEDARADGTLVHARVNEREHAAVVAFVVESTSGRAAGYTPRVASARADRHPPRPLGRAPERRRSDRRRGRARGVRLGVDLRDVGFGRRDPGRLDRRPHRPHRGRDRRPPDGGQNTRRRGDG